MKKTDKGKVNYPQGTSSESRRLCRKMLASFKLPQVDNVVIACSGGVDSTVLVHAFEQYCIISGIKPNLKVVYCNHNLRDSTELNAEMVHVRNITPNFAEFVCLDTSVEKGKGIQERARKIRYEKLMGYVDSLPGKSVMMMAHSASDQVETKLFQFLSGRVVSGIPALYEKTDKCIIYRPLMSFFRNEIEEYAKTFKISWCEDSSNKKNDYTRNKIRHDLIPWIRENINSGFEKALVV
jgi:tRNA(Ile)-lysidine synthase